MDSRLVRVARGRYHVPMGLRDRVLSSVKKAFDRFSGEYSAGQDEIRPDTPPTPGVAGEVKVTRARLKRPKDAKQELEG